MISQKSISQILVFALMFLICIFTSACTNDNKGSISIEHKSKLRNLQRQEARNPKIVYLGTTNEKNYTMDNFGPRDLYFGDDVIPIR